MTTIEDATTEGPRMVRVNASAQRRLESGHQWVFSNEITDKIQKLEPGTLVSIGNNKSRALATGYANPQSLVAIRALAGPDEQIDEAFFEDRISAALQRRRRIYPDLATFRLVHGEADGLTGLVIDKYADHLAVQVLTAGMEALQPVWLPVLERLLQPASIVARNDTPLRAYEKLEENVTVLSGEPATLLEVEEFGVSYALDIRAGENTGLYLDQKESRRQVASLAEGADVLDVLCYSGAWGIAAACAGARSVVGIDNSQEAVDAAMRNAELNSVAERCTYECGDAFEWLPNSSAEGRDFDIVIVDPPAFAKRRSELKQATRGYRDINIQALNLVRPGGVLVTSTRSQHMAGEQFRNVIVQAGRATGRTLRLIEMRGAAPDHPVLLSMRETEYLTCLILEVD